MPQGNFSGTVTGVAFIDAFNTPTYSSGEALLPGVAVTLVGNARFTGTAVDDTATTNGNGVFTFQNVLPGTYRLSSSAVPGLHYSSVNIGGVVSSSSTRTGSPFALPAGHTVTEDVGYVGGLSSSSISMLQFLTTTTQTNFIPAVPGFRVSAC